MLVHVCERLHIEGILYSGVCCVYIPFLHLTYTCKANTVRGEEYKHLLTSKYTSQGFMGARKGHSEVLRRMYLIFQQTLLTYTQ